jgi:hypothetical protein
VPGSWVPVRCLRNPVVELPDVGVEPPEELEALVASRLPAMHTNATTTSRQFAS